MTESADPKPGCSHDDENHSDKPAEAAAKRRVMFNPFRSLKKLFTHHGRKSDANAVVESSSQLDQVQIRLTPDVTTSSSTDVNLQDISSPTERSNEHASSSKKKCSGRQVSVSMENVIPEETSTGQTGARFGSGRLLDLKLGGSRAHSTDGVASSSAVFSDYPSSLLWKSDSHLTRSFTSLSTTHDESVVFTFRQANAINVEDIEEVFFASSRPSENGAIDDSATADTERVDLDVLGRSSANMLNSQAAMHKRAVRPRGRRTLTVYQPYVVQHKTDTVDKVELSTEEAVQVISEKNDVSDAGHRDDDDDAAAGGQTRKSNSNQSDYTTSEERTPDDSKLSANSVHLRKVPKLRSHEDVTTKRRQTVAVSNDVAEALASHSAAGHGRVTVQRESSMKLAPSAGQPEAPSELEQAFSKLRRRTSQIAQSCQTSVGIEQNVAADAQESVKGSSNAVHFNPVTSQKSTLVRSQPVKVGFSRLGPDWKSMSSLVSHESAVQKTSLMKSSQTFQPGDNLMSNTKRNSVALAASSSDSNCVSSTQVNTTGVPSGAQSDNSHSAESEESAINSSLLRSSDKEVTKPAECTGDLISAVTEPAEKCTPSSDARYVSQSGSKPESRTSVKTSIPSMDSEETADVERRSDCVSKKQASTFTAAEALASRTSCVVKKSTSEVGPTSDVDQQQPLANCQFLRQKSCPGETEHCVNNTATHPLRRSLDASYDSMPHAVQGLRSCAEWKMDDSGNKLEIKLRKSHSIALKPRKDPTETVASPGTRSALKRTTSTIDSSPYHPPVHQDVLPYARQVKVSAESSDEMASGTCIYQSEKTWLADSAAAGHVPRLQSLKAGQIIAEKKLPSVAVTGIRCDGIPGEPVWFALARQKTQRWTEGQV